MTDYRDLACDPTITLDVVARLQASLPRDGFVPDTALDPDLGWILDQLGEGDETTEYVTCDECGGDGEIAITHDGIEARHAARVLRQLRDAVELADLLELRQDGADHG